MRQVGKAASEGDTKAHQERAVAVPHGAVALLRNFRESLGKLAKDPFVFSPDANHGRPYLPMAFTTMFRRVAEATGLPYQLHQLRHFSPTQLVAQGFNPVAVAGRLGHADPSVTLRVYSHALKDRDRAADHAFGALVAPRTLPEWAE